MGGDLAVVVGVALLPAPMVPADCDLRSFPFMPLDVARLRDSDLVATCGAEAFRAALLLWCAAWHQLPAASLPDDDRVLANLAGYGCVVREWRKVRGEALRGFVRCSDGRLYHPVVADKANEAWASKLRQRWLAECARVKKHNQRHATELAVVPLEEWLAAGCPPGQVLFVPGDSAGKTPGPGLQQIQTQEERKKEPPNQPTTCKSARAAEPVVSALVAGPVIDDSPFGRVCAAVGFVPSAAKRAAETAIVAGWLEGWQGVDLQADVIDVAAAVLMRREGATSSLARFSKAVLDRKARALAAKATQRVYDHSDEGQNAADLRRAIGKSLAAEVVRQWIEPCLLVIGEGAVSVVAPSAFHAEWVQNQYGCQVRAAVANGHAGALVRFDVGGPACR